MANKVTYRCVSILEALGESAKDGLFVLLLDNVWSRGKYAEGSLSLSYFSRLAALEKCAQQFGPVLV